MCAWPVFCIFTFRLVRFFTLPRPLPGSPLTKPRYGDDAVKEPLEKARLMREQLEVLMIGFHEVVRQVSVHCAERGELLEAIRSQLANRETILRARLASQADELERLRRDPDASRYFNASGEVLAQCVNRADYNHFGGHSCHWPARTHGHDVRGFVHDDDHDYHG